MRKTFLMLIAAVAVAFASAAPADAGWHHHKRAKVAPVAGAIVGTVVGVGLYNSWFTIGGTATAASSVAGSAAFGGIAGVATIALIDAATTKCRGFHALFGGKGCVNGKYVGHGHKHYRHKHKRKHRHHR